MVCGDGGWAEGGGEGCVSWKERVWVSQMVCGGVGGIVGGTRTRRKWCGAVQNLVQTLCHVCVPTEGWVDGQKAMAKIYKGVSGSKVAVV